MIVVTISPSCEDSNRRTAQATWLVPEGHRSCGTAPDSHRLRYLPYHPAEGPGRAIIPRARAASGTRAPRLSEMRPEYTRFRASGRARCKPDAKPAGLAQTVTGSNRGLTRPGPGQTPVRPGLTPTMTDLAPGLQKAHGYAFSRARACMAEASSASSPAPVVADSWR